LTTPSGQWVGSAQTLTWNVANRLANVTGTGINGSAINESYLYDDTGQRIKKTSNGTNTYYPFADYHLENGYKVKYYFFNGQPIARYQANGNNFLYLHADHLGSVVLTTYSGSGGVRDIQTYCVGACPELVEGANSAAAPVAPPAMTSTRANTSPARIMIRRACTTTGRATMMTTWGSSSAPIPSCRMHQASSRITGSCIRSAIRCGIPTQRGIAQLWKMAMQIGRAMAHVGGWHIQFTGLVLPQNKNNFRTIGVSHRTRGYVTSRPGVLQQPSIYSHFMIRIMVHLRAEPA